MLSKRTCRLFLSLAATASVATAAGAELGGSLTTVRADGGRMGARMSSQSMRSYARHDLTRSNGGLVHEFTNPAGQVFAVTWAGPGKPDLRAVLGRYFTTFQAAGGQAAGGAGGRMNRASRRPAQVDQSDLQIQTAGHMGWFRGVAFIPSLAPAGFAVSDLPSPQ